MNALPQITPAQARLPRTYEAAGAGVYFLLSDDGHVKIGVTNDIASRVSGLQTAQAKPLSLIRFVHGGPKTERWLHRRFEASRVRGEWFRFEPDMLTVTPPDEVPVKRKVVKRRDVRLTLWERIKQQEEMMIGIGASDSQAMMMICQSLTDEECGEVRRMIRKWAAQTLNDPAT